MSAASEDNLRREMLAISRQMNALGLNQGTSGNLSARLRGERFLITPSGVDYDLMKPADMALMHRDGRWWGRLRPSTEWRFHRDILSARQDVGAVLHLHARHATALACLGLGLPPFHYMIAAAGGPDIRCAPYATFGSAELSANALAALEGRRACLLANHGLIVVERDLARALKLAIEVETLAAMYLDARRLGEPRHLSLAEMERVLGLFRSYGTADFPDAELRHAAAKRSPVRRPIGPASRKRTASNTRKPRR